MRDRYVTTVGVLALILAAASMAGAEGPGYFPVEEMGLFTAGGLEVDVNLEGAMLQAVAGAMEGQDGQLAEMVANLDRSRVMVGSTEGADPGAVKIRFDDAVGRLEGAGWTRILRVEEEEEQVYLFALEAAGSISGLTVLVNDGGEEAVVVNIAGPIDPRVLGRLLSNMGEMPDLEELLEIAE